MEVDFDGALWHQKILYSVERCMKDVCGCVSVSDGRATDFGRGAHFGICNVSYRTVIRIIHILDSDPLATCCTAR